MNKYYTKLLLISLSFLLISRPAIANSCHQSELITKESLLFPENLEYKTQSENDPNKINRKLLKPKLSKAVMWWAVKQFDPFDGNLVEKWFLSARQRQINLTVDWQLWTLLDYFDRYRFTNQFGTVARKHGYSLKIIDRQNQCLATYTHNLIDDSSKWELHLEKNGRNSFQADPQSASALPIEN